ncbi:MAG: hypothetical protein IPP72_21405 [Chitinophagaceae bacterium]|nr:hypothetical protein [Chitinophagaceae bacterium]
MINFITAPVKNFLKKHFYILKVRNKFTPAVQITQRQLFLHYQQQLKREESVNLADTGFKVFSQHEEDGMLLFIFAVTGMKHKTFVDIGANDGVNSNCANLAINFGWYGLFIDSDKDAIKRGEHFYNKYPDPWDYKPVFICQQTTRENINHIINNAGFTGTIGLLSIDIDGNDYWIWEAITCISPEVVIIEAKVEFGFNDVVVPYDACYSHLTKNPLYNGASPFAINKLANRKGYRLVGANAYGHNMIFIKNELAAGFIPEVSVASILCHPKTIESLKEFELVKHFEFVKG